MTLLLLRCIAVLAILDPAAQARGPQELSIAGPVTKLPKFFGPALAADLPLVKGDLLPISTTTSARQSQTISSFTVVSIMSLSLSLN